jgi:hypothetical protein
VAGLSEQEMTEKSAAEQEAIFKQVMLASPDVMSTFNSKQYLLIAWCVLDDDSDTPAWETPEAAEAALDYEVASELATACAEVNRLTAETHKEEQLTFFDRPKSDSGTL